MSISAWPAASPVSPCLNITPADPAHAPRPIQSLPCRHDSMKASRKRAAPPSWLSAGGISAMPYAPSPDGTRLYYEEAGSGHPLLFIHEFAGDHESWEPQLRHFARRYRSIAYNARGYPPSDVPADAGAYSQAHAVADAIAVLDHLAIERAHVVGLSMGGFATLPSRPRSSAARLGAGRRRLRLRRPARCPPRIPARDPGGRRAPRAGGDGDGRRRLRAGADSGAIPGHRTRAAGPPFATA